MTHKNNMPKVVELSQEEMDSLFSRLDHSSLSQEDSAEEDPRAPSNENKAPLHKAKGHVRLGSAKKKVIRAVDQR